MNTGPPKQRVGGSSARGSRGSAGDPEAPPGAGAQRRRRRRKPDRSRLWRIVLWGAVAAAAAWVAIAMVVFLGDDEEQPPPRPEEISAGPAGCAPLDFSVVPGEGVIFRVTNTTDSDFEVIVTDEAGVALRTSPGYDPDEPINVGAWGSGGQPASDAAAPPLLAAGILAHDGHETEEGPDATADFRYRMIVAHTGVRIMVVTFPEIGEFDPLTRIICAALGPDGELDLTMPVGVIEVTGG